MKRELGARVQARAHYRKPKLALLAGFVIASAAALSNCGEVATLSVRDGSGVAPILPEPKRTLIPTVNIAPAIGWPDGRLPVSATGTTVKAFASGLDHPRWLYVLPNGDVLVAETNAPPKAESKGIRAWFMKRTMKKAGASTPSANRISLLRDTDEDGVADFRSVLISGLNSPFGMALVADKTPKNSASVDSPNAAGAANRATLYVANTDAVVSFRYIEGQTQIRAAANQLVALPGGPINHHWTKNLIASPDGAKLYVTVGSNSNVAERGMAVETGRAAIWQVDIRSGAHRIFASGLRNPVGLAWVSNTRANNASASNASASKVSATTDAVVLWTVVNERDELGSDLVPDYLTSVRDQAFYGWPYSYFGAHVDQRVAPQRPELVAKALMPDYALGPHTACLGLANSAGNSLPAVFANGVFIGQHGSWNRQPHSGYKVIFVPFANGLPDGAAVDVLTGFLSPDGKAYGRPVGVALDKQGALLVADDVGNVIWRVSSNSTVKPLVN